MSSTIPRVHFQISMLNCAKWLVINSSCFTSKYINWLFFIYLLRPTVLYKTNNIFAISSPMTISLFYVLFILNSICVYKYFIQFQVHNFILSTYNSLFYILYKYLNWNLQIERIRNRDISHLYLTNNCVFFSIQKQK